MTPAPAAEANADLRTEILRLLALALDADVAHVAETARRDQLHIDEIGRRDELHLAETERRTDLHEHDAVRMRERYEHEIALMRAALDTREMIGQAKGIIMATMRCTADDAFAVLSKQSQNENRKLYDVAAEVVTTAQRRR